MNEEITIEKQAAKEAARLNNEREKVRCKKLALEKKLLKPFELTWFEILKFLFKFTTMKFIIINKVMLDEYSRLIKDEDSLLCSYLDKSRESNPIRNC